MRAEEALVLQEVFPHVLAKDREYRLVPIGVQIVCPWVALLIKCDTNED